MGDDLKSDKRPSVAAQRELARRVDAKPERISVRFLRKSGAYNAGDVAGFHQKIVTKFLDAGVAELAAANG